MAASAQGTVSRVQPSVRPWCPFRVGWRCVLLRMEVRAVDHEQSVRGLGYDAAINCSRTMESSALRVALLVILMSTISCPSLCYRARLSLCCTLHAVYIVPSHNAVIFPRCPHNQFAESWGSSRALAHVLPRWLLARRYMSLRHAMARVAAAKVSVSETVRDSVLLMESVMVSAQAVGTPGRPD